MLSILYFVRSPGAYDAAIYGKKTHRRLECNVYLRDTDFEEGTVNIEISLILRPILRRTVKNVCDSPILRTEARALKTSSLKFCSQSCFCCSMIKVTGVLTIFVQATGKSIQTYKLTDGFLQTLTVIELCPIAVVISDDTALIFIFLPHAGA